MRTHIFCEYLHKNEKIRETVFACSYEAQVKFFDPKKVSKIFWHYPFKAYSDNKKKKNEKRDVALSHLTTLL